MPQRSGSFPSSPRASAPILLSRIPPVDVGDKIPGYRTSAAFFTSLKANLRLVEGSATPPLSASTESLPVFNNEPAGPTEHRRKSKSDSNVVYTAAPATAASPSKEKHPHQPNHPKKQTHGGSKLKSATTQPAEPLAKPPKSQSEAETPNTTNAVQHGRQTTQPHLYWTTCRKDLTSGLSLIASTVSEQQGLALRALLVHPINLFSYLLVLYLVRQSIVCTSNLVAIRRARNAAMAGSGGGHDDISNPSTWPTVCLAWLAISLATVGAANYITWQYIKLAERVSSSDASATGAATDQPPDAETVKSRLGSLYNRATDELLVAIIPDPSHPAPRDSQSSPSSPSSPSEASTTTDPPANDVVVGSLLLSWVPSPPANPKSKRRRSSGGKAYVKAWAVSKEYRGKGVGAALLDEAVRVTLKERGGDAVLFSNSHAHSGRILPPLYNGLFDRRDRRAQAALAHALGALRPHTTGRKR